MAIGTPVSCGTNSKNASSGSDPLVVTLTTAIAAGSEIIVLVWAKGNRNPSAIADTGGNTYSQMVTANSGPGSSDTICRQFRAVATTALAISDTVTVTNSGIGAGGIAAEVIKVTGVSNATAASGTGSGNTGAVTANIDTGGKVNAVLFAATVQALGSAPTFDDPLDWAPLTGVAAEVSVGLSCHSSYRAVTVDNTYTYAPTSSSTTAEWSMTLSSLQESTATSGAGYLPLLGAGS